MALPDLAIEGVSVVLKGLFTPGMFSPAWFLMQELIGASEFEAAEVNVIAQEFASFKADWLEIQVTPDTFQVSTADPSEYERVRDLAVGTLRTLKHVPIALLGINRNAHFSAVTLERWHKIGDTLTPKDFWNDFMILPGMRSITMWGARPDLYAGHVQVQVEPSNVVPRGVYVAHNDHYALTNVEKRPTERSEAWADLNVAVEPVVAKNQFAASVLIEDWVNSMNRSLVAIEKVGDKWDSPR